jgi:hypothetical protein
MPLTIICLTGPGSTGKTSTIREFTRRYLGYHRPRGDVLGIFEMPRLRYAVGVSGSGDALYFILKGQKFLARYHGLRVMIVASRSNGITFQRVQQFATKTRAAFYPIPTTKIASTQERAQAVNQNVLEIRRRLPKK